MTGGWGVWQFVESASRAAVPVAVTLALTLLSTVAFGVPRLGPVMPLLPAIAVFYWAVYRPDLMPLTATFAIGLIHDALTGAPLGGTSFVLLVLQGAAGSQRALFHDKTIGFSWLGFAVLAALAAAVSWAVASLHHFRVMEATALATQYLLTVAVYPLAAWPLGFLQRDVLAPIKARSR